MVGARIMSEHIPNDKSWLDLRNLHELRGKRLVAQVSETRRFALYLRTGVDLILELESSRHGVERGSCLNIFRTTNRASNVRNLHELRAKDLCAKAFSEVRREESRKKINNTNTSHTLLEHSALTTRGPVQQLQRQGVPTTKYCDNCHKRVTPRTPAGRFMVNLLIGSHDLVHPSLLIMWKLQIINHSAKTKLSLSKNSLTGSRPLVIWAATP
ncbi:uncharacterized protein G2W53_026254 [Senna tora]|uniref:Uncharacterized protein n=1 Tax=Senna tora TaxID=362788 RepID=A0A834TNJ9_9FABA|nr:uncharacterized protein G2W53_026254 [Senna tora]